MTNAGGADGGSDHYTRLRSAQAESLLDSIWLTLAGNLFIASTTAWILWEIGESANLMGWLALVVILSLVRATACRYILARDLHRTDPVGVLKFLTFAALASGAAWTPVPLHFAVHSDSYTFGYIIFVMAGTTTGSIIQSLPYSRTAIAFGTPVMGATLFMMIHGGGTVEFFLATNVAMLTLMLFRASVLNEKAFVQSQNVAMRSSELAHSLAAANAEISKTSARLQHLANSDVLTGLANRAVFNRRMTTLFDQPGETGEEIVLLLIDLDKFKTINDTRGHGAGDAVLKIVARRIALLCRGTGLGLRLGGDEFAVLVVGRGARARAITLAQAVLDALAKPILHGGQVLPVGASIGVACAPHDAATADDLYACADLALYCAKTEGRRRFKQFDAVLKGRLDYERAIDRDLVGALERGEMEVHFQPQVAMASGRVTGFEALIRWFHPEIGAVPPPDIVAAATKLNISERLTSYVAERACMFVRSLDRAGLKDATLSINMSPSEFELYCPARLLGEITRRYDVQPSRIEVEITEDAILEPSKVERTFAELRKAGFRLAVDDFGMGHSSLAHLIRLKIDRLKVDRQFVTDIAGSTHHQVLVAALVSVGRSLDMELVLEGVETAADAETLRALGCQTAQGWLYGKAMSASDALAWLDRQGARVRAA